LVFGISLHILVPITQDIENALTPAHFLCGERLTALLSGTEPQMGKKSHEGAPKDTKTGRQLLEPLGEGIPPGVKKLP
jgi:hypothetical protein